MMTDKGAVLDRAKRRTPPIILASQEIKAWVSALAIRERSLVLLSAACAG
jgi:hypothetical protein